MCLGYSVQLLELVLRCLSCGRPIVQTDDARELGAGYYPGVIVLGVVNCVV